MAFMKAYCNCRDGRNFVYVVHLSVSQVEGCLAHRKCMGSKYLLSENILPPRMVPFLSTWLLWSLFFQLSSTLSLLFIGSDSIVQKTEQSLDHLLVNKGCAVDFCFTETVEPRSAHFFRCGLCSEQRDYHDAYLTAVLVIAWRTCFHSAADS